MPTSTSILSQYVNRLFGAPRAASTRHMPGRRPSALGHGFERLEDRMVLSVSLGSALSIGNDTGSSSARDVATDQAGNTYLLGTFSGTVDFDQAAAHAGDTDILTAQGSGDAFVAKYAPDDSLVWVRRMGGDGADSGAKLAVDSGGNVVVVGTYSGSADFGSTILTTVSSAGFVAKLNPGGTVQWAKEAGSWGVGVDSAGNAYTLSRVAGDFDIRKFSPSGAAVWSKSIATQAQFASGDLTVDASGNVFVVGSFRGTVDFDPGPKTKYVSSGANVGVNEAAFVLKLNTQGKFDWVSPFVGQLVDGVKGFAFANSVAVDNSGNIIVGGTYANSVDFNPGSGTTTLPTIGGAFITKLNSSGSLVWARALESAGSTFVWGLTVDTAGAIYATGNFFGAVDFDPGAGNQTRMTAGSSDVFVMKLTAAGSFSWVESLGGTESDYSHGIAVDTTGVVHLAGQYRGTVDFDPDPLLAYNMTTPGPFANAFRVRLRQV